MDYICCGCHVSQRGRACTASGVGLEFMQVYNFGDTYSWHLVPLKSKKKLFNYDFSLGAIFLVKENSFSFNSRVLSHFRDILFAILYKELNEASSLL